MNLKNQKRASRLSGYRKSRISRRKALVAFGTFAVTSALRDFGGEARDFGAGIPEARASALPARLRELLAAFGKCPGLEARFSEEKMIALLAAPLKSSGKVYFYPPKSLARIVEKPRRSHLVVQGAKIIVREGSERREVDFSDKPALRGLIGSLLHILAGNEQRLEADFHAAFKEDASGWHLELKPKQEALRKLVTALAFSGKDLRLSELRIKEANGDETVTHFSEVNEKRTFSPAEIKEYFEI